jgi:hypothetical protein
MVTRGVVSKLISLSSTGGTPILLISFRIDGADTPVDNTDRLAQLS